MDSSSDYEIFDVTLESDFVVVSLASDAMDFTMDSEIWKEVEIEDTAAVTDDSTQGVNEPPLTSTPKKGVPILSLGKLHEQCLCSVSTSSFILPLVD